MPRPVLSDPEDRECLPAVLERFPVTVLMFADPAQVEMGVSRTDEVTELAGQLQGLLKMVVGVVVAAQLGVRTGEPAVGVDLSSRVGAAGRVQRDELNSDQDLPVPLPVENGC